MLVNTCGLWHSNLKQCPPTYYSCDLSVRRTIVKLMTEKEKLPTCQQVYMPRVTRVDMSLKAQSWTVEATQALLSLWGRENVQKQIKKGTFESIAGSLNSLGYEFTWKQCRTRVRNLTYYYRKVGLAVIVRYNIIAGTVFSELVGAEINADL